MWADIYHFCSKCLVCASRKGPGRSTRPPLVPIPVGGPFNWLGVDVLQLPTSNTGNRYVVCFVDYLTKWVEAFATSDQRAEIIACLFVEHVVCRHGVSEQLLSERGPNFLSKRIQHVCEILGVSKINTVLKFEVFILGGQRIDQKRKKGLWRGSRVERKETKGN